MNPPPPPPTAHCRPPHHLSHNSNRSCQIASSSDVIQSRSLHPPHRMRRPSSSSNNQVGFRSYPSLHRHRLLAGFTSVFSFVFWRESYPHHARYSSLVFLPSQEIERYATPKFLSVRRLVSGILKTFSTENILCRKSGYDSGCWTQTFTWPGIRFGAWCCHFNAVLRSNCWWFSMKGGRLGGGGVFRFAIFSCAAPCSKKAERIGCQQSFRWISIEVRNFERQGLVSFGRSACCC